VGICGAVAAEPGESHWFGAVELTLLQPTFNNPPAFGLNQPEAVVTPRFILGWESQHGFGVRTRFWNFDGDFQPRTEWLVPGGGVVTWDYDVQLDAHRFDFDLYRRFSFLNGSVVLGASAASVILDLTAISQGPTFTLLDDYSLEQRGGGVGFFAEGRHRFYTSQRADWSLLSRGRWTAFVTDSRDSRLRPLTTEVRSNISIFEAGLGVEFKRKFQAADFVIQYYLEGQSWAVSDLGLGYSGSPVDRSIGFLGSTVGIGFVR
jgi:hypothetical protein